MIASNIYENLPNFNCFKCKKRRDHETTKKFLGCGFQVDRTVFTHESIRFKQCPSSIRDPSHGLKSIEYDLISKGINPQGGAYSDVLYKDFQAARIWQGLNGERDRN